MTDVNTVFYINKKILLNFEKEKDKLPELYEKRKILEDILLEREDLEKSLDRISYTNIIKKTENDISLLNEQIEEIEEGTKKNFYVSETSGILNDLNSILLKPINFKFNTRNNSSTNLEKRKLIKKFFSIAEHYIKININKTKKIGTEQQKKSTICDNENCKEKDFEYSENGTIICMSCGQEQKNVSFTTSFKDVERANISTKYSYERELNFKIAIDQFQGKNIIEIPLQLKKDLEYKFEIAGLLVGDKKTTHLHIRFSNTTEKQFSVFLEMLGYKKFINYVRLIYFEFTGIRLHWIEHLRETLLTDFRIFTKEYDNKYLKEKNERKSYINVYHILYYLLKKNKYRCSKKDFKILKTVNKENDLDGTCEEIFQSLGWTY